MAERCAKENVWNDTKLMYLYRERDGSLFSEKVYLDFGKTQRRGGVVVAEKGVPC